ncbi:MAG: hypothetical protein IIB87_04925 [Chloroflexi bacterium]|nr:hypothetical protein [Chloroflexota bacterium]
MVTTSEPQRQSESSNGPADAAAKRSAAEAAEKLERTLSHFETMLQALEGQLQGSPPPAADAEANSVEPAGWKDGMERFFERLDSAIERLDVQAARLSDGASDLALVAGRVEAVLSDLTRTLGRATRLEETRAAPEPESSVPAEPQFQPGDQAVGVVLAAVPGFQGLMDAQRALSNLPEAEGASVVAYKNGEASLEMVLREPVTASRVVEALSESANQPLLIEESRPEALRLRLRFVEQEGGASA